ncbi:mechanosensitive ion channel protein [Aurantiacibacter aquimixticola]|uniref:Mechanosensitive ion channel protein n=2 Tax=Aurantiacibacter aquimixticola TaxID=1958945 RepID=A0A419RT60_9SPHN|nr:mechanosensitive ion channel protein [Aurantiacibacter aquimixticola]
MANPVEAADENASGDQSAQSGGETATPEENPAAEAAEGAEALKEAVADTTPTVGSLIEQLDAWGFTVMDTRFSVWTVLVVVLVILGIFLFARITTALAKSGLKRATKLDVSQRLLAEKVLTVALWAIAILIGIDILGIDLTALAVFSGAFGLAIGFGLQKTFGNLIAGIILLMDKSIKPGDVINIADQAGNETFGQIRKIGIRAVSITTRDEREYLIPNENLMINQVENWSYSSRKVRMQVPVGVSYGCDMKLSQKLMLDAAKACKRVLKSPAPTVWMAEYGDSSVNFIIHCWINDPEMGVGNVKSEVLNTLWDLFQENDIEIPFPQRDLNLRGNEEFQQLVAAISQRVSGKADGGDKGPAESN